MASTSTLAVDRTTGIIADGQDAVLITVTMRDAAGAPTAGVTVNLAASGSDNTLPATGVTNAAGVLQAQLKSTRAEAKVVSATFVLSGVGNVELPQRPTVTFVPGAASSLSFTASPTTTVAGAPLAPVPAVRVVDAFGNALSGSVVSLGLDGGTAGASLGGSTSAVSDAGAALFPGLVLTRAGRGYVLVASAADAGSVSSAPFDVTAGSATVLAFVPPPTQGVAGELLTPFDVTVSDSHGNAAGGLVSLSIAGQTLRGTTVQPTDAGAARFADLAVDRAGNHLLAAALMGQAPMATSALTIRPGPPSRTQSTLVAQPTQTSADGQSPIALTVSVVDAFTNPVPGVPVTLRATGRDGGPLVDAGAPLDAGTVPDGGPAGGALAGLALVQPAAATNDAGVSAGSATCDVGQEVLFSAWLPDGGQLGLGVPATFVECMPTMTMACYRGPPGTAGVGACTAGTKTCQANGLWGPCIGEVLPIAEICGNSVDDDCTGAADDVPDVDGDGFTRCTGDCCETTATCPVPTAVGPTAFEVAGNGVDDDCDTATDEAPTACDTGTLNANTPGDYARAIGLCSGVLNAQFFGFGGANGPAARAILTQFGTNTAALNRPSEGAKLIALSTGRANTGPHDFGTAFDNTIGGGSISAPHPSPQGDPGACGSQDSPNVSDLSELRLTIRVPANARSLSFDSQFFSAEYPTFRCSQFDDTFLVLMQSQQFNGNVLFDANGRVMSVNGSFMSTCIDDPGGTKLFCGTTLATGAPANNCTVEGAAGAAVMAGTGFVFDNTIDCTDGNPSSDGAGATSRLTTTVPVTPGETITLRFVLFDEGDDQIDSMALVDNLRWSTTVVAGPVTQQ